MISKFFVEFTVEGDTMPTRNINKIIYRYLTTNFIIDFIPLIPFSFFLDLNGKEKHFYIIKVMRLVNGFRILDVS